jgi:hypothetical protein
MEEYIHDIREENFAARMDLDVVERAKLATEEVVQDDCSIIRCSWVDHGD